MKKVNFLIGSLANGGAERVISNLSMNLSDDILHNIILYGDDCKIDYEYKSNLIYLDKIKEKNKVFKIYAFFKRVKLIKKLKLNDSELCTISFLEYPNLLNAVTSKYGKSIVSVRNHMSTKFNSGLSSIFWNLTIKHLYPRVDKIIAVSEEIKKDLVVNYGIDESKIQVIYNSYPIKKIKDLSNVELEGAYKSIFNKPVVITAGRLCKQKGQWNIIRAFSKVKEAVKDAQLVIMGRGEYEEDLINLSKKLNLDKDIHFIGFQDNPFKFISQSKVFVLSSFHEGFPNSLAEAMCCEIPIISTDCLSGPREILSPMEFNIEKVDYSINKNRYGILVPVCDSNKNISSTPLSYEEEILSDRMIKILYDENLRDLFSKKSKERIKEFNIDNIIKLWESII